MRNHSYHMVTVFLVGLFIGVFSPSFLLAEQVRLAWDANNEPDIAGYRVYYGTSSGNYGSIIDVGNTTTSILDIDPGRTYYIAVTAYDDGGNESAYSTELRRSGYVDVPGNNWAYNFVMNVSDGGITSGCQADNPDTAENEANFCPDNPITRGQMAVFIETSLGHPPNNPCTAMFDDVPPNHPFCGFIERMADDGITGGCWGNNFCPNEPVTRGQMAVFIESALGNNPDICSDQFADVPFTHQFCGFIERLAADGITTGCGGNNFCPNAPVTRAQMAIFLVTAPDPLFP